jgi:hypothetical protein
MLVMNKRRFDALPEELRRILLERSGAHAAGIAGQAFDARDAEVVALVQAQGHTVSPLAEEEKARWIAAVRPVVEAWISASQARGFDGRALLAEARASVVKYEPPPAAPAPAPPATVPGTPPTTLQPAPATPPPAASLAPPNTLPSGVLAPPSGRPSPPIGAIAPAPQPGASP